MIDETDDGEEGLAEVAAMVEANRDRIRTLNDQLRMEHRGGSVVITPGISALGAAHFAAILRAVGAFKDFNPDNDPYGEHDCAVMTVEGVRIIWKIDYFDRTQRFHSPNAADPSVTRRVLTIMRADEY